MKDEGVNSVTKAYHRLKALKSSLPEQIYVNEGWVQEFHSIIDSVDDVLDLNEFRVPSEYLTPLDQNPVGADILAGYRGVEYVPHLTKERYIGRKTFCIKLDALLSYLNEVRGSEQ